MLSPLRYLELTDLCKLWYSILLLLEADYSNDDSVVRAIWSASNGLGPGFEDDFLEDRFVVKLVLHAPNRTHLTVPALITSGSPWIVVLIPWAMVFGRSLLSAGAALASSLATPAPGPRRSSSFLGQSPTEAGRSLPGALAWSLDAFAPAPLDSAIPANMSLSATSTPNVLAKGPAGARRALSISPSSSFSSLSSPSTHCASPEPNSLASPGPRPEDLGFRPTAFRRPRTISAYQLAAQGYTGPMRREAKTPLRLRQRYNGNWASMWPRPATPQGPRQGDSITLSGLNLPRPAGQPQRARKVAPAPRLIPTNADKESARPVTTTPTGPPPPPSSRATAPLRERNANVRTPGHFNARFTANDTEDTVVLGSCTPRAAPSAVDKPVHARGRMAPPPALPLAPRGPKSTTPLAAPPAQVISRFTARTSSPSAPLALSSTPVRAAPYSKRRTSPPPTLASSPRAGASTPMRAATVMASTPPHPRHPRQDKGKARVISPPAFLPSQNATVSDETSTAKSCDDHGDTVRKHDVELSSDVLAGLGMAAFPGLTPVQPRPGHTSGRLCLPSLGIPACVATQKPAAKPQAAKVAKVNAPRTVTILSPPVSSGTAVSRAPTTPASAPRNLGKSIRAGASVRARAAAMEGLATVSGTTATAPASSLAPSAPAPRTDTPSASRPSSADAPMSKASQHIAAMLEEIDRETKVRFGGAPPPGCRPATPSAAVPPLRDPKAMQAEWERHLAEDLSESSIRSFDLVRSSRKRQATEYDWMHADVAPLDESLLQAFKKQRQPAPRPAFGRHDSLDRLASRQTSGSPIRLDAPRRRPATVALCGATAVGPRLPPIVRPITVVKVNGVVVMDLTSGSPAPSSRSFVHPANVSAPPAPGNASTPAAPVDTTVASSPGSSFSFAARSFSLEAAKRSAKVKEAGRRRMAEVKLAIGQRRERLEKVRLQQQHDAEEAARQQRQQRPATPKRKTSSSRPRSPLRSCRSQVKSAARRHCMGAALKVGSSSTEQPANESVHIVVTSPTSPSRIASPPLASSSALLATPQVALNDRAPAQLVEPLEADYSNDDGVVRAMPRASSVRTWARLPRRVAGGPIDRKVQALASPKSRFWCELTPLP